MVIVSILMKDLNRSKTDNDLNMSRKRGYNPARSGAGWVGRGYKPRLRLCGEHWLINVAVCPSSVRFLSVPGMRENW